VVTALPASWGAVRPQLSFLLRFLDVSFFNSKVRFDYHVGNAYVWRRHAASIGGFIRLHMLVCFVAVAACELYSATSPTV